MNILGRFIVRPEGDGSRLMVGMMIPGNGVIRPGVVYELREVLGEVVLKEVGEPHMDKRNWGREIGVVITGMDGTHLMTTEEYEERERIRAMEEPDSWMSMECKKNGDLPREDRVRCRDCDITDCPD